MNRIWLSGLKGQVTVGPDRVSFGVAALRVPNNLEHLGCRAFFDTSSRASRSHLRHLRKNGFRPVSHE